MISSQQGFSKILSAYGSRITTIEVQPANLQNLLPLLVLKKNEKFLPRLKNLNIEFYNDSIDENIKPLTTKEIQLPGESLNNLKVENLRVTVEKLEDTIPASEKMDQVLESLQKLTLFILQLSLTMILKKASDYF